ncbi:MAG: hypothetical protein KDA90_16145 [Planctomycetaceae bacterium]|nr:hypothetical protein [Planctomycetaceae bacterium]
MTDDNQPQTAEEFIDLLSEKDDVILTLTARLEETADQLDRLQRMGVDRLHGGESSGGGAEQRALNARLGAMLDLAEDIQPAEKLDRIEQGIDSILRLLEQRTSFSGEPARETAAPIAKKSNDVAKPNAQGNSSADPADEDFWEQTKKRLMGQAPESGPADSIHDSTPAPPASRHVEPRPEANTAAETVTPLVDPPAQIEPEATPEQLLKGIEERDRYIQYMISRLRQAEQTCFPQDWELLAAAPEELRAAVQDLRGKLQSQLRKAELANAIERAALGRERAKLFQVKQQLEQQIRKLGKGGSSETPNVTDRLKALLGRS